jgi:hypothetical protein
MKSLKEPRMRKTTLDLPDPIWRKAKIRAMDEGKPLTQVVIAALELYFKTVPKEPPR